jgi:signal transduction histidine kinase
VIASGSVARPLRNAVVAAALTGAVIALAIAAIVAGIATSRMEHSALDAASVVVRDAVGASSARDTAVKLETLRSSLDTWGVSAAAFDRHGAFEAGDERLRADGLPAGRASAPLAGRQMALVETRDGYVLLTVDLGVVWRLRASVAGGVVLTLAVVWAIALLAGGRWAAVRGENAELLREQREERLRAFLAEAAHELRTPLAIAIGYVGILERGGLGDPDLAARIVRDVANEHTRLQRLVERILQLARLDAVAGDGTAIADVERIATEAIALVRPLDAERPITIESDGPAWAAIAPDELRDALRNALENAVRYAPGAAIRVVIASDGRGITTAIIDAGPGMDSFSAEHAFDRFFRGPDRGDVPGTGLGLAIVRRIAERAGGRAGLTSALGSGTTVTLRLPSAPPGG